MQLYRVDDGDYWSWIMAPDAEEAKRTHLREVSQPEDKNDVLTAEICTLEHLGQSVDGLDMSLEEYLSTGPTDEAWVAFVCQDLA